MKAGEKNYQDLDRIIHPFPEGDTHPGHTAFNTSDVIASETVEANSPVPLEVLANSSASLDNTALSSARLDVPANNPAPLDAAASSTAAFDVLVNSPEALDVSTRSLVRHPQASNIPPLDRQRPVLADINGEYDEEIIETKSSEV